MKKSVYRLNPPLLQSSTVNFVLGREVVAAPMLILHISIVQQYYTISELNTISELFSLVET